jgi:hypothetical protein
MPTPIGQPYIFILPDEFEVSPHPARLAGGLMPTSSRFGLRRWLHKPPHGQHAGITATPQSQNYSKKAM